MKGRLRLAWSVVALSVLLWPGLAWSQHRSARAEWMVGYKRMEDADAAQAALAAAEEMANNAQSTVSSGSDVVSAARENLQTNFNVKVFQLILLIAAGLAAFMLVFSMVMFVVHRKEN